MSDRAKLRMKLDVPHLAGTEMLVEAFSGREAISEPFAFEVSFLSNAEIDPADAVGKPATFTAEVGDHELKVAGVIAEFRLEDPTPSRDLAYVLTIGPRLGLLELSRQNQVYGTQDATSLPDLVDAILTNRYGQTSTTGGHKQTVPSNQNFVASYPSRRHVVQYEESDLAFLSRLCEHDGVFYFFEHGDDGDTANFGDDNIAFKQADLPDGAKVSFRRQRQMHRPGEPAITSFRATARPVAGKVYLRDYYEGTPDMQLLVNAAVAGDGPGVVVEHGANFDSMERGNALARVRAEEIACRRMVFSGEATVPQLRPGFFFTLSEHPNMALEACYLVVEAHHSATTPTPIAFTPGGGARSYVNAITCIRFDVPFRPRRSTPPARPPGLFTAKVDAEGSGSRAEIDDAGRYKVRLAYDEANAPDGKASTEIRRAQPYAGPDDSGLHFPLLKSTEVVVSYLNGDPDRPVILGALANPLTPDVVTSASNVFNRIRSASGTLFEINDGVAAAAKQVASSALPAAAHAEAPAAAAVQPPAKSPSPSPAPLPLAPHGDAGGEAATTASQIFTRFDVPSVPGGQPRTGNYIRLGSYIPDEESGIVPGVTYSSSTASTTDVDPEQVAADDPKHKQTQNERSSATVTATSHTSSYNGILVYTAQDKNETITGASLAKFGTGHATETTTGDSTHTVKDGQYTLFAKTGISLTAGSSSAADPAADLKLTASNYIKQTAYGPLSEATYGDSRKITYGNSYDEFHGTKTSYFYGDETAYKMATSKQFYLNALLTIKASTELTLAASVTTKITVGGDLKIAAPFDMKIIGGVNGTIVAGMDVKSVAGVTIKLTTQDVKIVASTDMKIVGNADTKMVLADIKFCEMKHESNIMGGTVQTLTVDDEMVKSEGSAVMCANQKVSSFISAIRNYM